MIKTFYDGHDELYLHAKFEEDRTMHDGCRCENVMFVFCLFVCLFVGHAPSRSIITGRMPQSGKLPLSYIL